MTWAAASGRAAFRRDALALALRQWDLTAPSVRAEVVPVVPGQESDAAVLMIAHNLGIIRSLCDRVGVMYAGRIVEEGPAREVIANPRHPYTQSLLSAAPIPDPEVETQRRRIILQGDVPSPMNPPSGCVFHTRCPMADGLCKAELPAWRNLGTNEKPHMVVCHHAS